MNDRRPRRVVVRPAETGGDGSDGRRAAGWVLVILGLAFLAVGSLDLALLWLPLRFDSLAWEFATVGRTLDALPMTLLGLGLVAYGASRQRRFGRLWTIGSAVLFALFTLGLLGLAALLATSAPAVLQQTPAEAMEGVRRALIRHVGQLVVYPLACGAITGILWRRRRSR